LTWQAPKLPKGEQGACHPREIQNIQYCIELVAQPAGQELPRDAQGEKLAGKKIPVQLSDAEQASHRHEYCVTPSSILP
jgi:hypothetical protein